MGLRRRAVDLSVERPAGPAGPSDGTVRLTARFEVDPEGNVPSPTDLKKALDDLTADLETLVGPPLAAAPVSRPERELEELVQTYRPRQRELVDLLRDEGELSPAEHRRLSEYLARRADTPAPPGAAPIPVPDRPLAAAPVVVDRTLPTARPVSALLREYGIASLKQAGAVRARRQISFAEYMALKQHFESPPAEGGARTAGSG